MPAAALLQVRSLTLEVEGPRGPVAVVDRVSLVVERGETVGLIGESGCGKSLTALALLRLLPAGVRCRGGEVLLDGEDLLAMPERRLRRIRGGRIGLVFQEPAALNPVLRVGSQVEEVIGTHRSLTRRERRREAIRLLGEVGLPEPERLFRRHPHELSGGQGQRVLLALALAGDPELLVADEPTTALDVTVQAEILERLRGLQKERDLAILWISHDLAVIAELCRRAAVMYAGRIVEVAPLAALFATPRHPYTRGLLAAVPRPDADGLPEGIPGAVPAPGGFPEGCRFRGRCAEEHEACRSEPPWRDGKDGHGAACWLEAAP